MGSIAKPVQFYPSGTTSKIHGVQFCFPSLFNASSRESECHQTWFMQDLEVRGPVISLRAVVSLVLDFHIREM